MSQSLNITKVATITTLGTITIYLLSKPISKYGLSGCLRYVWEGDHLPPHVRDAFDELDKVEYKQLKKERKRLEKIEVTIQLAKLNSVDSGMEGNDKKSSASSSADSTVVEGDETLNDILAQTPTLTKDLAGLSYSLDVLASTVDSVGSHGNVDVKARKKVLSNALVQMMERVDSFLKECGVSVNPQAR